MKNISKNKTESPKTPGGISKSLLTPCRRIGLSRNVRKSGPSPFISPLASNSSNVDIKQEVRETRKRKERALNPEIDATNPMDHDNLEDLTASTSNENIVSTPSRTISFPRKKSKTLPVTESPCNINLTPENNLNNCEYNVTPKNTETLITKENEVSNVGQIDPIQTATPTRSRSKKSISKLKIHTPGEAKKIEADNNTLGHAMAPTNTSEAIKPLQKSPNELTKECIVVIQKKIFKKSVSKSTKDDCNTVSINNQNKENGEKKDNLELKVEDKKYSSQVLFDSDSDEVPLSNLNKKQKIETILLDDDDDEFRANTKVKVKKLEDKTTSTSSLTKTKSSKDLKTSKLSSNTIKKEPQVPTQSHIDDDDDDFENKKTIIIKRTYDKPAKPTKAKSTGSITKKEIDDLKSRIELKKKQLLAKGMTEDTAELRELVKKWQKGCQDAIMELLDLMKLKFSDKQNMDYSEILKMLNIPSSLVGYDSENDCFNTPDDANIILSNFNEY